MSDTHERRRSHASDISMGAMDDLTRGVSLTVNLCGGPMADDNPKFEIYVSNGFTYWDVVRTYNEFNFLAMILETKYDSMPRFSIPPLYGPNKMRTMNETLREGLQLFLTQLSSQLPDVMESHFVDFIAGNKYIFMSFVKAGILQRQVQTLENTVSDLTNQVKNSNSLMQMMFVSNQDLQRRFDALEKLVSKTSGSGSPLGNIMPGNGTKMEASVQFVNETSTGLTDGANPRGSLHKIWNFRTLEEEEEEEEEEEPKPEAVPVLPLDCKRRFDENVDWAGDLITASPEATPMDNETAEVIRALWPLRTQTAHRSSVADFTVKMIKSVLNTRAHVTGMVNLDCFLPDDPLSIMVFSTTEQAQEEEWCVQLANAFRNLSGGSIDDVADTFDGLEGRELGGHHVKNVHISHEEIDTLSPSFSLRTSVDNIDINIRMGNHSDLLLTALIEEIAIRVAKDHLFKRTWILLSAWWKYEVAQDVQSGLVSESELVVMLCAVFNQYHARIHHPLQALSIFFAEYIGLEMATHVITLYGVYPVSALEDGSICSRPEHLMATGHLDQYCKWYTTATTNEASSKTSPSAAQGSCASGGIFGYQASVAGQDASSARFPVGPVNIAHPLCAKENMALGSTGVADAKATTLGKAISDGTEAIRFMLESKETSSLKAFFSTTWARFRDGFRPDVGTLHDIGMSTSELRVSFDVDLERLLEEVSYANMVIAGDVSERGFKLLFREMLTERGALPVGEIGKMLQESTGFRSLTTSLKSIYGGLKKFLEKCADEFLIGKNHPFNPHVYLLKYLNPKELQIIADGGILVNYMAKFKKKHTVRSRRTDGRSQRYGANSGDRGNSGSYSGGFGQQQQQHNTGYFGGQGNSASHSSGNVVRRASIPPTERHFSGGEGGERGGGTFEGFRGREVKEFIPNSHREHTFTHQQHQHQNQQQMHYNSHSHGSNHVGDHSKDRRGKRNSYPDGTSYYHNGRGQASPEPEVISRSMSDKSRGY